MRGGGSTGEDPAMPGQFSVSLPSISQAGYQNVRVPTVYLYLKENLSERT